MNLLYPDHYKALEKANLAPDIPPSFREVLNIIETSDELKKNKEKKRPNKNRQTFFCIGISDAFRGKNAIHILLKKLRNKHNLKWLRISMSYHKFPNLRELFSGDLTGKMMRDIDSLDFIDRECNCNKASLVDGRCIYG